MKKIGVGIIGPGNIGSDLMYKILRSNTLNMKMMCGIVESEGIIRAKDLGVKASVGDLSELLADQSIKIVFECTSAAVHMAHAPLLKKAGKIVIDLTPAAIGPYAMPLINLNEVKIADNLNMVTCGGQATVPIVYAVSRIVPVPYAEIIASIASKAAGPGTRQNIDEFTVTTAKSLVVLGGAREGKAIIILNPADPPVMMNNTVYCEVGDLREQQLENVLNSIQETVKLMQGFVPGYALKTPPLYDGNKITVFIQVTGQGDFLPIYAGNLDIINCAAIQVAERLTDMLLGG